MNLPPSPSRVVSHRVQRGNSLPSILFTLITVAAAVYAFSPRPQPHFTPTQQFPDRLLLNGLVRQDNRLVAVGEQAKILYADTVNGPWQAAKVEPDRGTTLNQALVVAPNVMVAVGAESWIIRSEDAGVTWKEVLYDTEKSEPLAGLAGPYDDKLFAYGAFGLFLVSEDLGKTWKRETLTEAVAAPPVAEAPAPDATAEAAAGAEATPPASGSVTDAVTALVDAGAEASADPAAETAEPVAAEDPNANPFANFMAGGSISDRHLNAMTRAADGTLILVGERGLIARSSDKGATWVSIPDVYQGSFFGVLSLPTKQLIAFGMRGNVFVSQDLGLTWTKSETGVQNSLFGGAMNSRGEPVLVGASNSILVSKDKGSSFQQATPPNRKGLAAVLSLPTGEWLTAGEAGIQLQSPGAVRTNGGAK